MSTIRTTDASPVLVARVRDFATRNRLGTSAAVAELLARGLDATEQRAAAGSKSRDTMTAEQRSARARLAAAVRWLDGKVYPLDVHGLASAAVRLHRAPRGGLIATFSAPCPVCQTIRTADAPVTGLPSRVSVSIPCCGVELDLRLDLGSTLTTT